VVASRLTAPSGPENGSQQSLRTALDGVEAVGECLIDEQCQRIVGVIGERALNSNVRERAEALLPRNVTKQRRRRRRIGRRADPDQLGPQAQSSTAVLPRGPLAAAIARADIGQSGE
jgi:hypothetical protein